jgi:hypothetical protein
MQQEARANVSEWIKAGVAVLAMGSKLIILHRLSKTRIFKVSQRRHTNVSCGSSRRRKSKKRW